MKHFLFLEKGPKWANIEKLSFSKSLNSQNLFVKSLEIGPWICRSDVAQMHFWYFQALFGTASQSSRLSQINALGINQSC